MKTDNLKKHIIDTIKEWQIKIGYREENMKLYYPAVSLRKLLGLGEVTDNELCGALAEFAEETKELFGEIRISGGKERYCIDIPAQGCRYVAEKIPDPEFLKCFLAEITKTGGSLEGIRRCFSQSADEQGVDYIERDQTGSGMGHVFFFTGDGIDDYIYCVEEDVFGLTYHRFTKAEYEEMAGK